MSRAVITPVLAVLLAAGTCRAADEPHDLKQLALRCGSEIEWLSSWSTAAERARAEHRPILIAFHALSGFDVPDASMVGPFMDQDIIDLVRARFVPLRFAKGSPAPFVAPDAYGMGPYTFGTSILVADADGKVIGDTFTMESSSLYDFLAEQAASFAPSDPPELAGAELAQWCLCRGDLARASVLLSKPATPREHRLRARLLRHQRQAEPALQELAQAGAADDPELALERAALLVRLDRFADARDALRVIPTSHRDALAAQFLDASVRLAQSDLAGAKTIWTALATSHPESRWGWLSAAYLSVAGALRGGGHGGWPSDEVLAAVRRPPAEPLPAAALERACADTERFLLAHQRADGSWISPAEVMGSGDRRLEPLVVATTALCARALLARDQVDARAAASRALAFVKDARRMREAVGETFALMDYEVWSKPCQLLLVADAIAAGVAEREAWQPFAAALVRELEAKQKSGGGWSYYRGADPNHLDPALDVSFSFVTAFVLTGLDAARRAGVLVPTAMTERALGCLDRMRNRDGSFEYSLAHANEKAPRTMLPAGAAGRGPLCELVRYQWGRGSQDDVRHALDAFLVHRASYAKEQGKTLMHCGLEGQGSHYLMFDYLFAAEAVAALPEESRAAYVEPVLELLLRARTAQGSFVDNPILGDHYGAAMALWALDRLAES